MFHQLLHINYGLLFFMRMNFSISLSFLRRLLFRSLPEESSSSSSPSPFLRLFETLLWFFCDGLKVKLFFFKSHAVDKGKKFFHEVEVDYFVDWVLNLDVKKKGFFFFQSFFFRANNFLGFFAQLLKKTFFLLLNKKII